MAAFYLLLITFNLLLIVDGQLDEVDEEPTVTILPSQDEISVRKGQDLFLMCQIQGPAITNCSWELNGAQRRLENITIENRLVNTRHYGKCRIAMKVTLEDIGKWTCNILTDADARPRSATAQVSLFQGKPRTIAGLVTIIVIGVVICATYVISFSLLKMFETMNERSFKINSNQVSKKKLAPVLSRGSSRESSDQFEEDVVMTTNPAAIDRC